MWHKILLFLVPFASPYIARGILPARFMQCALHPVDGRTSETTRPYRSYVILRARFQTSENDNEKVNAVRRPCQTPAVYFKAGSMCIVLVKRSEGSTPLGRPTRKWTWHEEAWSGLIWLGMETCGSETSGSIKCGVDPDKLRNC